MPPARIVFYAATVAMATLALRAILIKPVPLAWAAALGAAYVAIILCGVLVLRLRMFADAVVRGPKGARGVALTFDDGPHPVWTRKVLDALDARGAKATFFVIGRKAEAHPDLVKEIVARGHELGVHSYAHDRLFSLRGARAVRADLDRAISVLADITGERPTLFRPPVGHTNPTMARIAEALDLVTVGWTIGARDGVRGASPERVAARIRAHLRDGAIVLMHDAAERDDREPVAPRALPEVLEAIAAANLEIVPLARFLPD